ncbi:MAG: hypothetical protein KGL44_12925 [Sphingomonadales bacterium]|nr:hypothetical protein [Sphingomonadales bacterium]
MTGLAVILYARSGVMRAAFNAVGWDAIEVDTMPGQGEGLHWQGDAFAFMDTSLWRKADIAILHPVCTYVSGSGYHWNKRIPGRDACTLWSLHNIRRAIDRIERDDKPAVMENPVGLIGTNIRPATQSVQPYQFGDDASKRTCLWMFGGLPPLVTPPAPNGCRGALWRGKINRQSSAGQTRRTAARTALGLRKSAPA